MDKEMEVLLSEKEIKLNGKRVVVKRIALLDTLRLASRLSGIVGLALNSSDGVVSAIAKISYAGNSEIDGETESDINGIRIAGLAELLGLLGEDGTELLKDLIVKSTNLTDAEVENIDSVDGIDLIETIIEVNKDFFVKFVNKLKEKIQKIVPTKEEKKKSK